MIMGPAVLAILVFFEFLAAATLTIIVGSVHTTRDVKVSNSTTMKDPDFNAD